MMSSISSIESDSGLLPDEPSLDARLIVVGGNATKRRIDLKLPATLGRGSGATLLIMHNTVSRLHCEISERDGALVVRDLDSLNGTFVGETRVTQSVLRPGDLLTVGPLVFRVEYEHQGEFPRLLDHINLRTGDDRAGADEDWIVIEDPGEPPQDD